MDYFIADNTFKFCDGTNWVDMGGSGSGAGSGTWVYDGTTVISNQIVANSWVDLDVSSIVGAKQTLVMFYIESVDADINNQNIEFRTNGEMLNATSMSGASGTNVRGSTNIDGVAFAMTDTSGIVEIRGGGGVGGKVDVSVFGYMAESDMSGLWLAGGTGEIYFSSGSTPQVGIGTAAPRTTLDVVGTDAIVVPVGTTTQEPTAVNGMIRYDSTTNKFRGVTSGTWGDLSGGGSAPSGAVMYFDLASCPTGWSAYVTAEGRVLVGLPAGGTLAATVGTALTNQENRAVGLHSHTMQSTGSHSHSYVYERGAAVGSAEDQTGNNRNAGPTKNTGSGGNHSHTIYNAGSVSGTNAPYVQLLACKKN